MNFKGRRKHDRNVDKKNKYSCGKQNMQKEEYYKFKKNGFIEKVRDRSDKKYKNYECSVLKGDHEYRLSEEKDIYKTYECIACGSKKYDFQKSKRFYLDD